jgi:hypothetical protein
MKEATMPKVNVSNKVFWWVALILLIVGGVSFILEQLGAFALPYELTGWLLLISALLFAFVV